MWWRIALAALSGVIALSMAALYMGVVSVRVTMDAGKIPPRVPMVFRQPPIFYIAVAIVALAAMPLAVRLFRGHR
jgi:uncharacterized membrane protein